MKQLLITLLALLIIGCGGGGDSTPASTPDTASNDTKDTVTLGTAGLNVAPEFDFKTDITVSVDVVANLVNERAFINICQADTHLTNAQTCFVRAPLTANGLQISFTVPHKGHQVKAEIWYYDTSISPLRYEWQYDANQAQQTWVIN